jgi:transposase
MSDTELLPMSKPAAEPVRRLEVFTGAGRRRAWPAEEKARIVAESYAGDESVCAVARRHGLTPQQLFGWRRKARREAEDGTGDSGLAFAPVIVDAAPRHLEAPTTRRGRPLLIEIVIGAATVRVPAGIDAASLRAVLCAVRTAL